MDLSQAILSVLCQRRGFKHRIRRTALREMVARMMDCRVTDRVMRTTIEALRTEHPDGALICSTTREGGGYFLAANRDELENYLAEEESRIRETAQKVRLQRQRASHLLSPQMGLGI